MINGKSYDWEDITIRMPHGVLIDVDRIEYSDKKEATAVYGKGSNPRHYSRGNYSAEGKVTLYREEFQKLKDWMRSKGYTLYGCPPFTVTVSYANIDQPTVTDELRDCVFAENSASAAQGDQGVKVELGLVMFSPILWDGLSAN